MKTVPESFSEPESAGLLPSKPAKRPLVRTESKGWMPFFALKRPPLLDNARPDRDNCSTDDVTGAFSASGGRTGA